MLLNAFTYMIVSVNQNQNVTPIMAVGSILKLLRVRHVK